jgi:hypothetical protein
MMSERRKASSLIPNLKNILFITVSVMEINVRTVERDGVSQEEVEGILGCVQGLRDEVVAMIESIYRISEEESDIMMSSAMSIAKDTSKMDISLQFKEYILKDAKKTPETLRLGEEETSLLVEKGLRPFVVQLNALIAKLEGFKKKSV